ncbi:polyamine-modulated factor 1 isoform X4 [Pan paniscus]|uniref:polyamine-modulated factor 1 isoform X5 n=1 Tax=Pan troglodytes TaxID=9598 RepID=UPI0004F04550|nr:polyamine-modulated factor 1 isoform X5 [Pan troglodytes]XP_054969166.1 polyamine-modulated factor 1 isoform X4 [Pan paniscus]
MAEASTANLGSGCEEKRHEGSSSESVPPGTTISRVKLLDTMVDTFLQKLVAAGRRPSGIPEKDLHSVMAPYFLQQRDTLRRHVQKQEAENQQLADAVLAGRRQVEELQLQVQARQQAWQALHREQRELVAVLREPE